MTTPAASRATTASTADLATSDPAPLIPTLTAADPVTADPVTAEAELFTRIAADPPPTTAPEGRTP